jgi:hypothetical protein
MHGGGEVNTTDDNNIMYALMSSNRLSGSRVALAH